MTFTDPQNGWRAALTVALCGAIAALITVESPTKLHAQAPAGQGRGTIPPGEALFTSAQAHAGKAAYERNCANCHGASVDDGNSAPPLRGAAFLSKYAGKPAADLFTYVSTKMPTGNPGSLDGHGIQAMRGPAVSLSADSRRGVSPSPETIHSSARFRSRTV